MGKTKSRGRRAEKKEAEKELLQNAQSLAGENDSKVSQPSNIPNTFFGLVDSTEIEYFKQAESTLNINAFETDEERNGFISSVLEEAQGKELKLVTNQICSKLMERLILFADSSQLKAIFETFSGHFASLAFHKYSSHVLETFLVRAAALIELELTQTDEDYNEGHGEERDKDYNEEQERRQKVQEQSSSEKKSVEEMFLNMVNELKPYLSTMIDHQYASHVLRLLILILAGKELPSTTTSNSTLRSKKSKIARKMIEIKDNEDFDRAYQTPPSFKNELREYIQIITKDLDTKRARELSIHKVASPVLQLIIRVEGLVDRERTLWHLVFAKQSEEKVPEEESFVEYLLSDSVGSHFFEGIIKNDGARPQYIERLYKLYMKDRVLKLARRATTGVYIIQALMFKLKPVEVEYILDIIIPELANLISIADNQNLDLARRIVDASIIRGNYRRDDIIQQLFLKFAPNYDLSNPQSSTSTEFLENALQLTGSTLGNTRDDWPTAEERRRALFLEKLMELDYRFIICAWLNFMALPVERFVQMCMHGVFSHVVENALVVEKDEPKNVQILRKRFLNIFQGNIVTLACNSYGSHIVDKLWNFTVFLPMYKDRVALELMGEATKVKDSNYGKLVWKNWGMELFARKKYDWKSLIKAQENEFLGVDEDTERPLKPIELKMNNLARERKEQQERAEQAQMGYNKRKLDELTGNGEKRQKVRGRRRE
ncbi:Nucleolar protein 9 [Lodderomyces elongisporus]|uniref:Nucleolar protein 9 n=1 Tax=Lodderomyces elongisporus TaxID=36914 RepID=UPI00291DAFEF|nr:Nucleolar protein 9 [Lodderomyces elongisporus]WLF77947.1 Nucleolar protein 9 [Lodderomyces elongisporus]